MRPYLTGDFGNPSNLHWAAPGARQAIATARIPHLKYIFNTAPLNYPVNLIDCVKQDYNKLKLKQAMLQKGFFHLSSPPLAQADKCNQPLQPAGYLRRTAEHRPLFRSYPKGPSPAAVCGQRRLTLWQ
jgi:hypothetical protein